MTFKSGVVSVGVCGHDLCVPYSSRLDLAPVDVYKKEMKGLFCFK